MKKLLAYVGIVIGLLLEPFGIGIPIGMIASEELEKQNERSKLLD